MPNLKKNYLYRIFYEILVFVTPLITAPYVSRVLGADGIGDYSFTQSIVSYFMLVGALGTATYGEKEIAQNRDDPYKVSKLFWEIEILTIMTTGACLIVWIGVIIFGGRYSWFYLVLTPYIISTMGDITWFFTVQEKVKNIVARNTFVRLLNIVLLFVLVRSKDDILIYCGINSCTALLGNFSMWMYLPKMLVKVDRKDLRFKIHFHETLIYFIPSAAISIYTVLDKTLIGAITKDSYQNGFYEQATKIVSMLKSVVFVALNSVMFARISYLFTEKKYEEIKQRIAKSMNFMYFVGFGCVFGIVGIAETFVPFFLGDGFEPVISLLYCMAPLVLIIGTSNCLGNQYFTPSGQRKRSAKIIILGAAVNLVLNLLIIPWLGATGACIASVLAELTITVFLVHMSDEYMSWKQIGLFIYKRLIAGVVMCAVVMIIGKVSIIAPLPLLIIQIATGIMIYCGILWLFKDDMLFYLFEIVKKKLKKLKPSG